MTEDRRLTDLVRSSLPRTEVGRTASDYLAFHDEARGGVTRCPSCPRSGWS